jgi:putative oxidoreductase
MAQEMVQPGAAKSPASNKAVNVALWVFQILCAAAFLAAGGAKLANDPKMIEAFQQIGIGQWFRYVTGALEVLGAIGLLIPRFTFYGAALLAWIMICAVITCLAILGTSPLPALALLLFTGTIAYFRRPQ